MASSAIVPVKQNLSLAGQDPGESEAAMPIEAYPVDMVIEAWWLLAARAESDMQALFYRGYKYTTNYRAIV